MPTLEITTNIGCPVKCTFCPQDALTAAYPKDAPRMLTMRDFQTVLGKLPGYVRIDFSGYAEPWANPSCTDMLAYALRSGRGVAIYTTLVGMTIWDVDTVIELVRQHPAQVQTLCLHLPDQNGNMPGLRRTAGWMHALEAFLELERDRVIERFEKMTMDRDGKPVSTIPVERLLPWRANDRAGSLDRTDVLSSELATLEFPVVHDTPVTCSFTPFYDQNVLLPNGDVALCCMDYGLKHIIGNLFTQGYEEIFAGPALGALHAANMRHAAQGRSICKSCSRAQKYDVDTQRLQMWERVQ